MLICCDRAARGAAVVKMLNDGYEMVVLVEPVAMDSVNITNQFCLAPFPYCKIYILCFVCNQTFVFLQGETSQETSTVQETQRLEEVNDPELEIVTFVIFWKQLLFFVCLYFNCVCCLIRSVFQ